jgi:hypothetical protein
MHSTHWLGRWTGLGPHGCRLSRRLGRGWGRWVLTELGVWDQVLQSWLQCKGVREG